MDTTAQIKRKLATLIGHLISRCIREARMIPTVLHMEEIINILVDDPSLFARLVRDEHSNNAEVSRTDLTVKLDAVAELGKLDRIEILDQSFWEDREVDLAPILDLTNQLTRTFAVYMGNASTLFDKEFEAFMNKFRESLQRTGLSLRTIDFELEHMAIFEEIAAAYFDSGEFLQAFIFERLLSSQIMMRQVVNLPADFSLRENLIRRTIRNPKLRPAMIRFVLRISYISQGSWEDIVPILLKLVRQELGESSIAQMIDAVEREVVFCCNLLCTSYEEIRQLTPNQRRQRIESNLSEYATKASFLGGFN
jgi:hypothetical protein